MDELMAQLTNESDDGALGIDPIVKEAKERFDRCTEWESSARERFIDDLKFAHGDADNGWQWPNAIRRARDTDQKPCLTLNITRQHNLQIINELKKNKNGVKIRATGNGATKEAADIYMGLVRHIEYQSNAQDAYSTAVEFQVNGGIGYWRLLTDYPDPESWEQEIYLARVWDPLSVYLDPDIQEKDGSDADYGFVFDLVPKDDYEHYYSKYKNLESLAPLGSNTEINSTLAEDHVMLCEYFRRVRIADRLISFVAQEGGERQVILASKLPPDALKAVLKHPLTQWRWTERIEVQWKLIAGEKIIDETVWPGKYIPLIRVIGEETILDGMLDRKGHTRAMKDGQRMFNYNASSQVEFVALQSKTPWVAAAKAIEGFESYWNTANRVNYSVLPYNHVGDQGDEQIPAPTRQEPPQSSSAFQQGMDTAFNQLMMVSGQWQNQMGMMGNERTGDAIRRRQMQGDTATYHFTDNFNMALRNCGKQIIDLAPKIYDTKRIVQILAEDGTDFEIEIDPSARQAFTQKVNHDNEVVKRIFNPNMGKYEVQADVGPSYGTKREATQEALETILTQRPELTTIIGDLLLSSMDFPLSSEAAARLKRMVPAQALGKGPTQVEQQLQTQVQGLKAALIKALDQLAKEKIKLSGKDQKRDIEVYSQETDRMKALADILAGMQGESENGSAMPGVSDVVRQLIEDALSTHITDVTKANKGGLEEQSGEMGMGFAGGNALGGTDVAPPVAGARRAKDGQWYVNDPSRQGKYLRVNA